jgi:hypothetical protein
MPNDLVNSSSIFSQEGFGVLLTMGRPKRAPNLLPKRMAIYGFVAELYIGGKHGAIADG